MMEVKEVTLMLFETPGLDEREHEVLERIDALKEKLRWQLHEPRRWVGSLRRLSFARAIQGSNSIEGYNAKLDDAAAVAMGEEPLDANAETRLALEGYRDAMTYVLQMSGESDFDYSVQLLKSLHFMMTNYSLKNRPGRWRVGSVYVQKEETGEIVYEGPDLDEVPKLMKELVAELNVDAEGSPPLIRAGMAHLNLVMVHPFRDGNGRMARCLQSLVLARSGVLAPVFMSIEEYLGHNTQEYYDVLAEVGRGAWQPSNDAQPWLRFTLKAHLNQAMTLLRRVRESEKTWVELERMVELYGLPPRTMNVLFDASLRLRVRNSTYRAGLAEAGEEITEQTASRDLKQLVDRGLLVSMGERRGRYYVAGLQIQEMRRSIVGARHIIDRTDPFA
jgi:Fic family protein